MQFHHLFRRYKSSVPAGEIALGADVDPTGSATPDALRASTNVLHARFADNNGAPMHRIAVGYKGPANAIALNAAMFVYDGLSGEWYRVGPAVITLTPSAITFFDFVSVPEFTATQSNLGLSAGRSVDAYIRITDPGSAPNGEHVFVMAPDYKLIG
jgi:hypothetical protein